ncbi:MAG: DUF934 domain-containing protein [Tabrizicola sp.]|nr:DUF934 domain-containing protein [Tabrizicola sp.]
MSILVTDTGFLPAPPADAVPLAGIAAHRGVLDLAPTDDPAALRPYLADLTLIRVAFPVFSDGRAFTIARRLRMMGYGGALHAVGPLIADQYAMARRLGFDAVEIPDDLAARQPESQWLFRADWQAHEYQARLRA